MSMRKEVRILKLAHDPEFPKRFYKVSVFYADGAEADWDYADSAEEAAEIALEMLGEL